MLIDRMCKVKKNVDMIMEKRKILGRWVECIRELFEDQRKDYIVITL